eukprot:Hpha_TRINITY_DN4440_c0_g2::TRINITY_DN4440_c0_g2_i1::g.50551::m.50551
MAGPKPSPPPWTVPNAEYGTSEPLLPTTRHQKPRPSPPEWGLSPPGHPPHGGGLLSAQSPPTPRSALRHGHGHGPRQSDLLSVSVPPPPSPSQRRGSGGMRHINLESSQKSDRVDLCDLTGVDLLESQVVGGKAAPPGSGAASPAAPPPKKTQSFSVKQPTGLGRNESSSTQRKDSNGAGKVAPPKRRPGLAKSILRYDAERKKQQQQAHIAGVAGGPLILPLRGGSPLSIGGRGAENRASFRARRDLRLNPADLRQDSKDNLRRNSPAGMSFMASPMKRQASTPFKRSQTGMTDSASPLGTGTGGGWQLGKALLKKKAQGIIAAKKLEGAKKVEVEEEQPDAIVVRALIVLYLRRREFKTRMEEALEDQEAVTRDTFMGVWQAAVATSVRDALARFHVFNFHTHFKWNLDEEGVPITNRRHEEETLATAVFDLIDIDNSKSINQDEYDKFAEEVARVGDETQAAESPQTEQARQQEEEAKKEKEKTMSRVVRRKLEKKRKLIEMVHGTIRQMQRRVVSLALPRIFRAKFEKELKISVRPPVTPAKLVHLQKMFPDMYDRLFHIVESKYAFYEEMLKLARKRDRDNILKILELFEDKENIMPYIEDIETVAQKFSQASSGSLQLKKSRIQNAISVFGDEGIPVSELSMHCTRDPLQLPDSFNLEFCKQMRRRAYDMVALAFYILVLATTVAFFIEHEGTGRLPGDVFQTVAIDELIALEEKPGHTYRKTFFDIENVEAYWQWIYGPVLQFLWPRNFDASDINVTAAPAVQLGTYLLGGIKLQQTRANHMECPLVINLKEHSNQLDSCYFPSEDTDSPRFNHFQCFDDSIVNGLLGIRPGWSGEEDAFVGRNITDAYCTEDPEGQPDACTPVAPTDPTYVNFTVPVPSHRDWVPFHNKYRYSPNVYFKNETEEERMYRFLEPWVYHDCSDFDSSGGGMFSGRFGSAVGCEGYGLILPIAWNVLDVKKVLDTLVYNDWIDVQTRSVRMEFFTYNQHTSLFQRFQYIVEFSGGGLPVPSRDISSFAVFDHDYLTGSQAFFSGFSLFNLFGIAWVRMKVYWRKYRHRMKHTPIEGIWAHWYAISVVIRNSRIFPLDIMTVALTFVMINLKLVWISYGLGSSGILCQDRFPGGLESIADVQRLTNLMAAFTIAWLFLNLFYRLRTFKNARMLFDTLVLASTDILVIGTITAIIFMSLGIAAWLVYSQTNLDYASLGHTLLRLIMAMLGEFKLEELEMNRLQFTPIYFALFQGVSVIILLNMVVAVLTNALARVQDTKYDSSPFIRRINNDPGTRFPAPQSFDGKFNWVIKLPAAVRDELRLATHLVSYKVCPVCCGNAARDSRCFPGNAQLRYRAASMRSPRKVWEEYVKVLEMLEGGGPEQVIASTLIIGALVHRAGEQKLVTPRGAKESRILRGVFGSVTALSADDLLQEELSKGRKDEVEALLVMVPHALLGRSQVRLWVDILVVHDRWRRDADQWCKTDQPNNHELIVNFLTRIDASNKVINERLGRVEKELARVNEKVSMAADFSVTGFNRSYPQQPEDDEATQVSDTPNLLSTRDNSQAGQTFTTLYPPTRGNTSSLS